MRGLQGVLIPPHMELKHDISRTYRNIPVCGVCLFPPFICISIFRKQALWMRYHASPSEVLIPCHFLWRIFLAPCRLWCQVSVFVMEKKHTHTHTNYVYVYIYSRNSWNIYVIIGVKTCACIYMYPFMCFIHAHVGWCRVFKIFFGIQFLGYS